MRAVKTRIETVTEMKSLMRQMQHVDTHHLIVAVLRRQVQRDVTVQGNAVDRRAGAQQHQDRLSFTLPGCIMQRTHSCTSTHTDTVMKMKRMMMRMVMMNNLQGLIVKQIKVSCVSEKKKTCVRLTVTVSDVHGCLSLQQRRQQLAGPCESGMVQGRKPGRQRSKVTEPRGERSLIK